MSVNSVMSVEEINDQLDCYYGELDVRDRRLKLLFSFKEEEELDELSLMIDSLRDIVIVDCD